MTQKNCPNCESSRTNYVQNYGYWECEDCGHEWALDEDDPDYDELDDEDDSEPIDLGECCACGCAGATNILTLEYKTPVPGTGWGCVVCRIPYDGALAAVCDDCVVKIHQNKQSLKYAVSGFLTEKGRIEIEKLTEPFKHLDIPHK